MTTAAALTALYHHVDSLGHYGPTALIAPMYGGAELPQVRPYSTITPAWEGQ